MNRERTLPFHRLLPIRITRGKHLLELLLLTSLANTALPFMVNKPHFTIPRKSYSSKYYLSASHDSDLTQQKQPSDEIFNYSIGSINLLSRWMDLVEDGQVEAEVSGICYGVRTSTNPQNDDSPFEEYVKAIRDDLSKTVDRSTRDIANQINATLTSLQSKTSNGTTFAIRSRHSGNFAAQLQLVRTLRPPASAGFSGATSSTPPPYNAESDSFVTGPLRLWNLRPLVGKVSVPYTHRQWDVYHNISPADVRGHFLLLPTLDDRETWRGQSLLREDCIDLVSLATTIQPPGSVLLCYNSVGAGASQNHIHVHMWPCPPLPLKGKYGWECYAPSLASPMKGVKHLVSYTDDSCEGTVKVELLDYPCCAIRLNATDVNAASITDFESKNQNTAITGPITLGQTVSSILDAIGDAPYNICIHNQPSTSHSKASNESIDIIVYIFIRSRTCSPTFLPALKLGASEMMGLFHCQSEEELEDAVAPHSVGDKMFSGMEMALMDVSALKDDTWDAVRNKLLGKEQAQVWKEE